MKSFLRKYIPVGFFAALVLAAVSYLILSYATKNAAFADFVSGGVGALLRRAFAYITNPLKISAAEIFVILLVVAALSIIPISVFAVKRWRTRVRILFHILSFVFVMYSWYALSFGVSYHAEKIEKKMDFEIAEVTEDSLYELSHYLVGEINGLAPLLDRSQSGVSVMPYDLREMSEKIIAAYDEFLIDYPIFDNFTSYVKPVMLSELMAYASISGMYTYYTGEANISTVFPDYCIPATAIHELAHQRGVAREDEANFISFTVAEYSDDPYIKYSGYINLFEYTLSALRATDRDRANELYSMLDDVAVSDMLLYSDFYNAHKQTILRDISRLFNDTYLRLNGTPGVISYNRVVRLSVSYYKYIGIIE